MSTNKTDKVIPRERVYLMNAIAERDRIIQDQKKQIAYYRRTAEIATERRIRDRHERSERRKDIISWAVLALVLACVALPAVLYALEEFWRWGNGVM